MTKREPIVHDVMHHRAQVAVLSGLAAGDDVYDLTAAAAPSPVPGWFTPDVALLELAVMALDLACPAGAEPLELRGCGSGTCRRWRSAVASSTAAAGHALHLSALWTHAVTEPRLVNR